MALATLLIAIACDTHRVAPVPTPAAAPAQRSAARTAVRPSLPSTAAVWAFAEATATAEAWSAAADAYALERARCTEHCSELAYAVVLARKNAMEASGITPPAGDAPADLPPRVQALVDAFDDYVARAEPNDPDAAGMKFLAAATLNRWHQPEALDRFEAILGGDRSDETVEYAANLLLDTLNRAGRYDEMLAWVDALLADTAFLAGKDELRETLEHLRAVASAQ
jgi:hypothetical protein